MTVRVEVTPNAKLFSFDTGHQLAIYKDKDDQGECLRMVTAEYGISSATRIGLPDAIPADQLPTVMAAFLSKVDEAVATNCLSDLRKVLGSNVVIQKLIQQTGGPRQPTQFAKVVDSAAGQGLLVQATLDNVNSLVLVTEQGTAVLACPDVASQKVCFEHPALMLASPHMPGLMADFFAEAKPVMRGPRPGR